jgi:hypothetical protein
MDPILIVLIILGIIILSIIVYVIIKFFKFYKFLKNQPNQPLIGGCKGTRYGCCPMSNIAKHDPSGTNCH